MNARPIIGDSANTSQYRIATDTCSTGLSVDPGKTCVIGIQFMPMLAGDHPAQRESVVRPAVAPSRKSTPWPRAWASCRRRPTA